MLGSGQCPRIGDVWFNGYYHLLDGTIERLGPKQGEILSTHLRGLGLRWNAAFNGLAVVLNESGPLPTKTIGDLRLALLPPTRDKLVDLRAPWLKECKKAGLIPGVLPSQEPLPPEVEAFGSIDIEELASKPFEEDGSVPNGSSIALLLEQNGTRVLLSADAHVETLSAATDRLLAETGDNKLRLDLFKLPHHGSRKNVSRALLEKLDCSGYVFSTNGSYFNHPDPVAVARVLKYGGNRKTLYFNYRNDKTNIWNEPSWMNRYGYDAIYADENENGFLKIKFGR